MSYNTSLDLHGYDRYSALAEAKAFIDRHYQIGTKEITIVHGIGSNIIKDELHKLFKKEKRIAEFKLNKQNLGETIIKFCKN